jgi:hypothetical protein
MILRFINGVSLIFIAFAIVFSIWSQGHIPLFADSLYYQRLASLPVNLSISHPPVVPLLFRALGRAMTPAILALFIASLGYFFRRRLPLLWLPCLAIFCGFPLTLMHSTQIYCDLPLAFFYFTGVAALYEYMNDQSPRWLAVAGLFLILAVYTKAIGLPLVMLALFFLAVHQIIEYRSARFGLFVIAAVAIVCLPLAIGGGLVFLTHAGDFFGNKTQASVFVECYKRTFPLNFPTFFTFFFNRLMIYLDWGLLWWYFLAVLMFRFRPVIAGKSKYLAGIVLACLTMSAYILSRPAFFPCLIDGTMVQRIIFSFSPLALYFVGIELNEFYLADHSKKRW